MLGLFAIVTKYLQVIMASVEAPCVVSKVFVGFGIQLLPEPVTLPRGYTDWFDWLETLLQSFCLYLCVKGILILLLCANYCILWLTLVN